MQSNLEIKPEHSHCVRQNMKMGIPKISTSQSPIPYEIFYLTKKKKDFTSVTKLICFEKKMLL